MTEALRPNPAGGVFTTLLVVEGEPVELDAHLKRLASSVRELYAAALSPRVAELTEQRASELALGRLRLTARPVPGEDVRLDFTMQPVERSIVLPSWADALELRQVTVDDWQGGHKWADRRLLERLEAEVDPAGALLADSQKGVLETTRANVFVVDRDGVVRTPPADGSILPGVTRARVIEVARETGVEVREEPLSPEQLLEAAEVFATGSVRGVQPVRALDGIGIGAFGRITVALGSALEQRCFTGAPRRGTR